MNIFTTIKKLNDWVQRNTIALLDFVMGLCVGMIIVTIIIGKKEFIGYYIIVLIFTFFMKIIKLRHFRNSEVKELINETTPATIK